VPTEIVYVAHVKQIVQRCIEKLKREAAKSLDGEVPRNDADGGEGADAAKEDAAARRKEEKARRKEAEARRKETEAKHAAKRKEIDERVRAALRKMDEEKAATGDDAEAGPLLEENDGGQEEDGPMLEEN